MARPDHHRAALVDATAVLLRRQGYGATGLTQILDAADATNGSLYHHFPGGKEDLAAAALRQGADQITGLLRTVLAGDLESALGAWIDALVASLEADRRDGCPIAPTAVEAAGISEGLRQVAADAFAAWTREVAAALRRDGLTPKAARERARVLVASIEGALLLDRTSGTTEHLAALRTALPALVP